MSSYSSHVAGLYGEVQGLGSLVVRLVFWPIESIAFRVFSDRGDDADASAQNVTMARAQPDIAEVPASPHSADRTSAASQASNGNRLALLQTLHRMLIVVAALAAVFGPNYAFTAIHVLLSHRWSSTGAPDLLATYSLTLVLLALNGVTEAYTHARMSGAQLMRANVFMAAIAIAHAGAIWAAHTFDAAAENAHMLVLLDAASMAVRISYSYACIWRLHSGAVGTVQRWVPAPATLGLMAAAFAVLKLSAQRAAEQCAMLDLKGLRLPQPMLEHIAVGAAVLAALLAAIARTERALLHQMRQLTKPHRG